MVDSFLLNKNDWVKFRVKIFKFITPNKTLPVIKKIIPLALIAILYYSCKKDGGSMPVSEVDNATFTLYETHFLEALWKLDPDWATSTGYHKYDSLLLIPNSKSRSDMINFTKVQMDSLAKYDPNILSPGNKIDYHLIQNQLDATQWAIQQEKAYEWNPGSYNVIGTCSPTC
jgi:hypothetical protein